MNVFPVCFASLGPGDPELITLKTLRALREADVIIVPYTVGDDGKGKSRAADIVKANVPDADICTFELRMSSDRTAAKTAYDDVFEKASAYAFEGKRVVIGVEGDVSIYASIHYVMDRMAERGISVEQLPGVPSFIASAAIGRLSLISQHERLLIMPGVSNADDITDALDNKCVVVIMKLSGCESVMKKYMEEHKENVYHYVENASSSAEYNTNDGSQIASRHFPYFSLMIIRRAI